MLPISPPINTSGIAMSTVLNGLPENSENSSINAPNNKKHAMDAEPGARRLGGEKRDEALSNVGRKLTDGISFGDRLCDISGCVQSISHFADTFWLHGHFCNSTRVVLTSCLNVRQKENTWRQPPFTHVRKKLTATGP